MPEPLLMEKLEEKCPNCDNMMETMYYLYDSGITGKLWLIVSQCPHCSYRTSHVRPYEERKEGYKIELHVESDEELNVLVYRSGNASLKIPELGVEVEPMGFSQGDITTVEGYLEKIIDLVKGVSPDSDISLIERAKKGEVPFTLILEDPSGLSFIKSEKVKVTPL